MMLFWGKFVSVTILYAVGVVRREWSGVIKDVCVIIIDAAADLEMLLLLLLLFLL